jgi:hypothetical protein
VLVILPGVVGLFYVVWRARSLLAVLLLASVYQFYVPHLHASGTGLCVVLALGIILCRLDRLAIALRDPPFQLASLFLCFELVSFLWSPDIQAGRGWIGVELPFFAAYVETRSLPINRVVTAVTCGVYAACSASLLIIYFAFDHAAALTFYRSGLARVLVGPGARALFTPDGFNNVLIPGKSGGVFINANVGSLFCGVTAVIAICLFRFTRNRSLLAVGVVDYVAVVLTGSKTGLFLGILSLVLLVSLPRIAAKARHHVAIPLGVTVIGGITAYIVVTYSSIGAKGAQSLQAREVIWSAAKHILGPTPLAGLGFGGWQIAFAPYASAAGSVRVYPPHNLFLYTLSQSGILAVLCMSFFLFVLMRRTYRALSTQVAVGSACFVCVAWVIFHGLGDNTTLFGDEHSAAFIGAIVALSAKFRGNPVEALPSLIGVTTGQGIGASYLYWGRQARRLPVRDRAGGGGAH